MQLEAFLEVLKSKGISYETDVPMKQHTTFKIGGAADAFVTVSSEEQLGAVLRAAAHCGVPVLCVGKGSNLLVSDEGLAGAAVSLARLREIAVAGEEITCGAGAPLSALCAAARDASLSGLEFAYGIPGSVGGAVFMNAGAYGGEMAQAVCRVRAMAPDGTIELLSGDELRFGYRTSVFRTNGLIVTSVTVALRPGKREEISAKMEELMNRRREKQPLEYPSAGSTFKRPEGHFAGALIEKNGLKGARVGAAAVSEKHAGFIINTGGARAQDVRALIEKIRQTVLSADGVLLEPEVLFVGRS